MTIAFTSEILVPDNYTNFDEKILHLQINPGEDSLLADLNLTKWQIISITSTSMAI